MCFHCVLQSSGTAMGGIKFASSRRRVRFKTHVGRATWSRGWRGNFQLGFHAPLPPPMWLHQITPARFSQPPPYVKGGGDVWLALRETWRAAKQHWHHSKSLEILISVRRHTGRRFCVILKNTHIMGNVSRPTESDSLFSKVLGIKHSKKVNALYFSFNTQRK